MYLPVKLLSLVMIFSLLSLAAGAEEIPSRRVLWVEDFEHEEVPENIGTWEHNLLDSQQGIRLEIVERGPSGGEGGRALAIHFDVDSRNPAMVGCRVRLKDQDLSGFDTLHLSLKSSEVRFRGSVALQFTDHGNRKAPYLISGIGLEWRHYEIPLRKFSRITDWSQVKEFEIVIDDRNANPKEGTFFVDNIYLTYSKAEGLLRERK